MSEIRAVLSADIIRELGENHAEADMNLFSSDGTSDSVYCFQYAVYH